MHGLTLALAATTLLATGCSFAPLDEVDEIYYRWDGARVLCAAGIDGVTRNSLTSIQGGLDRALADGTVVQIYGHRPGKTVPLATIEGIVAHAESIGLPPITYRELAADPAPHAAYALSFDDNDLAAWTSMRDLLTAHGARVTFFVSRYARFDDDERAELRALWDDGHDVEPHSVDHLRAPQYVEEHGLDAYLRDEALPSLDVLRADGYPPVAYAYPFGARTRELDDALLEHVTLLRSVTYSLDNVVVADPCPE